LAAFFPSTAQEPWLSKRDFAVITAILVAFVLFISIARKPRAQMLICCFAIFGLVLISYLLRGGSARDRKSNVRAAFPFIVGLLAYPPFILSAIALAVHRMTPPVYFAVVVAELAGLAGFCRRHCLLFPPAMACLAIGAYCAASLFNASAGIARHSLEHVVTGGVLAIAFLVLASALRPTISTS
jgi:hypothetical protein